MKGDNFFLNIGKAYHTCSITKSLRSDIRTGNCNLGVRPIDIHWKYFGLIRNISSGFNPFESTIYIAKRSRLYQVMHRGPSVLKNQIQIDNFYYEFAFFLHDYLHLWSNSWASHYLSKLGIKIKSIKDNFEDIVFIHLLSESVATVGLDYWYLCQTGVSDKFKLKTNFEALTVPYRSINDKIYKSRFDGKFQIKSLNFFHELSVFYCNGIFEGFSKRDLLSNDLIKSWISKELLYGKLQRKYIRQWLLYLSGDKKEWTEKKLTKEIILKPWMYELINSIGKTLFDLVILKKNRVMPGKNLGFKFLTQDCKNTKIDSRFINLKTKKELMLAWKLEETKYWPCLSAQIVSRLNFSKIPIKHKLAIKEIIEKKEFKKLIKYRDFQKWTIRKGKKEPRHLFQLP